RLEAIANERAVLAVEIDPNLRPQLACVLLRHSISQNRDLTRDGDAVFRRTAAGVLRGDLTCQDRRRDPCGGHDGVRTLTRLETCTRSAANRPGSSLMVAGRMKISARNATIIVSASIPPNHALGLYSESASTPNAQLLMSAVVSEARPSCSVAISIAS